jgi:hypothetical protein
MTVRTEILDILSDGGFYALNVTEQVRSVVK